MMSGALSPRLRSIVDALPLRPGLSVLEIGCGPGACCREIARRIGHGFVLGIDRSAAAIAAARRTSQAEGAPEWLRFRHIAAEAYEALPSDPAFDVVFAVRVGALDGRHPQAGRMIVSRLAAVLSPHGAMYVEKEGKLVEVPVPR